MRKKLVRPLVAASPGYRINQPPHRVKLNQNEAPCDVPAALKQKILKRLGKAEWNRYPEPYADSLREELGQTLGWAPEGLLLANGSNVLTQALVASCAIRQRIVVPEPTFSLYELYGQLYENKVIKVPLEADFSMKPERFLAAFKRYTPALTFIPNPNAPTGRGFAEADLLRLIKACPGVCVLDEAYYPFSATTLLPHLKQFPQLIIMRTFSKAFSLAGVRVGYLIGHPELIAEIRKLVPPFCLNSLSELVAETVLKAPAFVSKVVRDLVRERERVYAGLATLRSVEAFPSQANFILIEFNPMGRLIDSVARTRRDQRTNKFLAHNAAS